MECGCAGVQVFGVATIRECGLRVGRKKVPGVSLDAVIINFGTNNCIILLKDSIYNHLLNL